MAEVQSIVYPSREPSDNKQRKILPELDRYEFSDEVIARAREIYSLAFSKEKRSRSRKYAIFFCIFNAYTELGYQVNPHNVAEAVGISVKEITKAKRCNDAKYKPRNVYSSPLDFIDSYYSLIDMNSGNLEAVRLFAQGILNKSTVLQDYRPQNIAAAIVYCYAVDSGFELSKEHYVASAGISWPTLQKLINKVEEVRSQ